MSDISKQELDAAKADLPKRGPREIFFANYMDGLDYAELSQRFDITENSVVKSLQRTREKLREQNPERAH